jgi:hypothetical protein
MLRENKKALTASTWNKKVELFRLTEQRHSDPISFQWREM